MVDNGLRRHWRIRRWIGPYRQAALGFDLALSKTSSLKFGYRHFSVDYDKSGVVYDMKNQGLHIGVGIRF